MLLAACFGSVLFIGLVLADWWHFTSLSPAASAYGVTVARVRSRVPAVPDAIAARFAGGGALALPHGIARLFSAPPRIVVRPQYHLFSLRFRTAWPLKGSITLHPAGDGTELTCRNLIPWSSAILTGLWFIVVAGGTISFVISFLLQGGFASLGGALMGLGIAGLGVLVLGFGVLVVTMAYRLEGHRLSTAYEELLEALGRD